MDGSVEAEVLDFRLPRITLDGGGVSSDMAAALAAGLGDAPLVLILLEAVGSAKLAGEGEEDLRGAGDGRELLEGGADVIARGCGGRGGNGLEITTAADVFPPGPMLSSSVDGDDESAESFPASSMSAVKSPLIMGGSELSVIPLLAVESVFFCPRSDFPAGAAAAAAAAALVADAGAGRGLKAAGFGRDTGFAVLDDDVTTPNDPAASFDPSLLFTEPARAVVVADEDDGSEAGAAFALVLGVTDLLLLVTGTTTAPAVAVFERTGLGLGEAAVASLDDEAGLGTGERASGLGTGERASTLLFTVDEEGLDAAELGLLLLLLRAETPPEEAAAEEDEEACLLLLVLRAETDAVVDFPDTAADLLVLLLRTGVLAVDPLLATLALAIFPCEGDTYRLLRSALGDSPVIEVRDAVREGGGGGATPPPDGVTLRLR